MARAKDRVAEAEALPPVTPEGVKESDSGTGEVSLRVVKGDNVDTYEERPTVYAPGVEEGDLEVQYETQGYRSSTTEEEPPEGYTDVAALQEG